MPRVKDPTQAYAGRRFDCRVINIALDEEAMQILETLCPKGQKSTGKLFGRLLYEHQARIEERRRLQQALQAVCAEEVSAG